VKLVYNSKLEVLHQYHGERNDLVISAAKLLGYERNVAYFLTKHPQALPMTPRGALKYLTGDWGAGKIRIFDLQAKWRKVTLELRDEAQLDAIKA
jgi:hypothetical protein